MTRPGEVFRRHLLVRALRTGGWLSAGYALGEYQSVMQALVVEGLFEVGVRDGRGVFVLTGRGRVVAEGVA